MNANTYFVVDFDSTFTKVEALDELCDIIFSGNQAQNMRQQVAQLTFDAMEGKISLRQALVERIELLKPRPEHLAKLSESLKEKISDSVLRNEAFFRQNRDRIFIISNGFKEFIVPVVEKLGIGAEQVYANSFLYDEQGQIMGIDMSNPLSESQGKVQVIKDLGLKGELVVIGDGYSDYEIREAGLAATFYAFTENISRPAVVSKADRVATSFEEVLYSQQLKSHQHPSRRRKVLLLENIHPLAIESFENQGFEVELLKEALEEAALIERIKEVCVLGIRSKTQVGAAVLEQAHQLLAVGAFCIGTNQIDLHAASQKGVAVFNAPFSNTRSVVEMAVCMMIGLLRQIPEKSSRLHAGYWDKSVTGSREIRGKVLGIVGYGNIGSQLSIIAEAMGMKVLFYDIEHKLAIGNAKACQSMDELLSKADIVSLHVDGRAENTALLSKNELANMKEGAYLLNLSRGHVLDIEALVEALKSKKLAGAGLDVYPYEPVHNAEKFVSPLQGLPNVILTPHIGGSTLEAQQDIATFVPGKLLDYIKTGNTSHSVNFPSVHLPQFGKAHRLIHIHHNQPGVLAEINQTLAAHHINIVGQYLKTNEQIGYSITDVNCQYNIQVIEALQSIENTIKFRILY